MQPRTVDVVRRSVAPLADVRVPVRQGGVLGDHVDDVHPEAVHAAVQPPAHHLVDRLPDLGVLPVEVGLLAGEQVQVVLAGVGVVLPGRPGEERPPVGGFGAGIAAVHALAGRSPPVPIALGIVRRRLRLDEPRVLVGGVVDHQVHHQLHAAAVHGLQQRIEIGEGAEDGLDVPVVADVVARVVLGRRVHRRQPDDVHAQLGQVVDLGGDPAQITDTVAVGVGETARVDLVDNGGLPPLPILRRHLRGLGGGRQDLVAAHRDSLLAGSRCGDRTAAG